MKQGREGHTLLNLRQMNYLIALAEHGSISAAAGALQMAQTSMSENIARLEKSLGIQLATRGSRGIQMTRAGELLAMRSAEILGRIDDAVHEVMNMSTEAQGVVELAMPPGISLLLSVPLLETIHAEYPDIRLSITEGLSGDILDWIENDRIDIGLAYDAYESSVFSREPMVTEEVFLVTAPDNWHGEIGPDGLAKDPVSVEDLADLPLVMTSSRGAQALQQKVSNHFGVHLDVIATLNSLPQIVEMVSRASAYAILAHGAVYRQVQQEKLAMVRIKDSALSRTAYMVRKRSKSSSRAVQVVEEHARSILREMMERYGIHASLPPHMVEQALQAAE